MNARRAFLLGAVALATGCAVAPGPVAAPPAPPPPREGEAVPVQPGPAYVWVPGHWAWRRGGYVWVPGAWMVPASPGYIWVPGRWVVRDRGHIWVEGHWRPR